MDGTLWDERLKKPRKLSAGEARVRRPKVAFSDDEKPWWGRLIISATGFALMLYVLYELFYPHVI
jgi:hypothetical protein